MSDGVSRRHFLYGALLAGAVPADGFGSVPSLRALGYKPYLRSKIRMLRPARIVGGRFLSQT
jgi:hypothetical protein